MSASGLDAAAGKVIAGIDDPRVEARYPNGTHFIAADNPRHGRMVTRALFGGDPVVLVYPDGREMLFTPERERGLAALLLLLLLPLAWLSYRSRNSRDNVVQLPRRIRVEARDSDGLPIAA
jgi:hypothetical protein